MKWSGVDSPLLRSTLFKSCSSSKAAAAAACGAVEHRSGVCSLENATPCAPKRACRCVRPLCRRCSLTVSLLRRAASVQCGGVHHVLLHGSRVLRPVDSLRNVRSSVTHSTVTLSRCIRHTPAPSLRRSSDAATQAIPLLPGQGHRRTVRLSPLFHSPRSERCTSPSHRVALLWRNEIAGPHGLCCDTEAIIVPHLRIFASTYYRGMNHPPTLLQSGSSLQGCRAPHSSSLLPSAPSSRKRHFVGVGCCLVRCCSSTSGELLTPSFASV